MKSVTRILLVLCFFLPSFLGAQERCNYTLQGRVVVDKSGESIPLATALILENEKSAVANSSGEFTIENLCAGQFTLTVRFQGFRPYQQKLTISSNTSLTIRLEETVTELGEITVEGEKVEEIATLKRNSLEAEELNAFKGETLGTALTNITGVNILQSGPTIAKPVIHGLHSNRILILNNGIRQEGQQWGQEHAPEIDPFVATNLTLIKGAAAVKYGSDAIGGVILVNPPELPRTAGVHGSVDIVGASNNRLYAGSMQVEGGVKGLEGFGWRAQGTYKRAGDARSSDYRLSNTGVQEQNFSLGVGYHKDNVGAELFYSSFDTEIAILRSAHIGNLTDFERAIGSDRPLVIRDFTYDILTPRQEVNHQLIKANGHIDLESLGEFNVQYGFQSNQRKEYDIRRGDRTNIPSLSLDLKTHTLDFDLDAKPIGRWKGDVGASFMYQNNQNTPGTGVRPLIPNFENWTAGAHVIGRYVQNSYEFEFGLRYDFKHYLIRRFDRSNNLLKPEFDFNNLTGSVGVLFNLKNNWVLRSNVGTAWRAPHVNELFSEGLHHGSAAIEEGSDQLASEKSIKWITSIEHSTTQSTFEVAAYYNYITDYIYLRPEDVTLTIRGAFPVFRYRQTDAVFVGLDLDHRYDFDSHWTLTSKLSLIRAEDQSTDAALINIPANSLEAGITYNFTSVDRIQDAFASLSVRGVDRQRNAPRVVSVAEIQAAKASDTDLFAIDDRAFDLLDVPEGYVLVNMNGGFTLPFGSTKLGVILSASNLFNVSYRDYLNRFRYYADDLGRNISLKLNFTF